MQEPSIQARKLNLLFLVRQINRNYVSPAAMKQSPIRLNAVKLTPKTLAQILRMTAVQIYTGFRRVRGLDHMTVSEMLETMHENDLFVIFSEFSKVVHILAVIPATSCSAERSFSALRQLKTYRLRSTIGQKRVSNIALISSYCVIVRVRVVLKRTVVGD